MFDKEFACWVIDRHTSQKHYDHSICSYKNTGMKYMFVCFGQVQEQFKNGLPMFIENVRLKTKIRSRTVFKITPRRWCVGFCFCGCWCGSAALNDASCSLRIFTKSSQWLNNKIVVFWKSIGATEEVNRTSVCTKSPSVECDGKSFIQSNVINANIVLENAVSLFNDWEVQEGFRLKCVYRQSMNIHYYNIAIQLYSPKLP